MTKDNSKNRRYIKEEKEKLIARMLPQEGISPSKLLAETTALLVLRKKSDAIFGENEED